MSFIYHFESFQMVYMVFYINELENLLFSSTGQSPLNHKNLPPSNTCLPPLQPVYHDSYCFQTR